MHAENGLYEKVLAQVALGADLPKPRRPRVSASVAPWRGNSRGDLEVFWVRRAETLRFMGGWFAFPGGGLSRGDAKTEVAGDPSGIDEAPAEAALPPAILDGIEELGPLLVPGLLTCALRELYEETGVLAESRVKSRSVDAISGGQSRRAELRRELLDRSIDFSSALEALGTTLDGSRLVYAGRWLTPPLGPIRFDNRFFLLEWTRDEPVQPTILPGELVDGEWIEPGDALGRWKRGEVLIAPPIQHILQVLAEDGVEDGRERLWNPQEANLGPFRRIEFRPGVLNFPLATPTLPPANFTNAYVLGTRESVLVDPGSPYSREIDRLLAGIEDTKVRLGRHVSAIWLTHHHPDHVGGVEAVRQALGVPVLADEATASRLEARGLAVDGLLKDGQTVELDGVNGAFPVQVIHTPGHARGHLCFYDPTYGSLIAGDMVAGFGTIVIDPPEGEMDAYLRSLVRLRDLKARTLFPAHGPALKNVDAKLEEYIDHRLWREGRVLEAWNAGHRETSAMLDVVYDEIAAVARPLAERQIEAHLERLRSLGKLESRG